VQGALYLLVLTVNSGIAIARGHSQAPGELPIWAPLLVCTGMVALALIIMAPAREEAE
jgi:hypothetical protein